MKTRALVAAFLIAALFGSLAPAPRALADGGASTRNILLGIGAAAGTLIIINHNKKVHAQYAADAQKQAATAAQANDAQAAYNAEKRAYDNQLAVTNELKKEVAIKDNIISQQKTALAQMGVQAPAVVPVAVAKPAPMTMGHSAQMLSYGWGTF